MDRYSTLRNGLVGAWCPSLGATGYMLLDRSGRQNNGTLFGGAGATWVASGSGTAVQFNGTSGYGTLGSNAALQPSVSAMTFSMWFYRTATLHFSGSCFFWGKPNAAFDGNGFYIEPGTPSLSNNPVVVFNGAATNYIRLNQAADTTFPLNAWTHFAFIVQGTSAQFYINGFPISTTVVGTPAITATTDTKYIFLNSPGYGNYTPGRWDDLRIYSRAMSQAGIKLLASQRGIGLIPTRHRRGSALSQFWTRVAGEWKRATPWINVGGTWKKSTPKINVSGTWKG